MRIVREAAWLRLPGAPEWRRREPPALYADGHFGVLLHRGSFQVMEAPGSRRASWDGSLRA